MSDESPQRPTSNDDREGWMAYWAEQGMPWRTEPEIGEERQRYLAKRRAVTPDSERGIYPFRDENGSITLTRADVEWLLATHESDGMRGPVDWDDVNQRERQGLDLRGADLRGVFLGGLPLARVIAGFYPVIRRARRDLKPYSVEAHLAAQARMDGAILFHAHLEGAKLAEAQFNGASLHLAWCEKADFTEAQLKRAWIRGAHLQGADLTRADLSYAELSEAHLEAAELFEAHVEHANLELAHLEGANLFAAHLESTYAAGAHFEGAYMLGVHLEESSLEEAHMEGALLQLAHFEGALLRGTHLGGRMLTTAEVSNLRKWSEDFPSTLRPADLRRSFFNMATTLDGVKLGEPDFGCVLLADVRWGDVNLAVVRWSGERHRRNFMPSYDELMLIGDERAAWQKTDEEGKPKDDNTRLREFEDAARANQQLAIALRAQGITDYADRYAYRAQVLQRQVLWSQRKRLSSLGSWLLWAIAGYGYRPRRSVATYALVVGLFAVGYFVMRDSVHPSLNPVDAIIFSITSFHGRGFNPGESATLHNPLTIAAAVEAVIGLLIEITFIATFTQRFFAR